MPTTRNTISSTEPLAVPADALALWEYGPRATPIAHLTVEVGVGAAHADQVVILAGRAYAEAARTVWPHARTPLAGTRGIGHQRARLAEIIRTSTLPTTTHEATAA